MEFGFRGHFFGVSLSRWFSGDGRSRSDFLACRGRPASVTWVAHLPQQVIDERTAEGKLFDIILATIRAPVDAEGQSPLLYARS